MSCDRQNGLAQKAGVGAGVSALGSRLSYLAGLMSRPANDLSGQLRRAGCRLVAGVDRVIDRVGPVQGQVAAAVLDHPVGAARVRQAVEPVVAGGARVAVALFPPARTAFKTIKTIERVSSLAGNVVGAVSKTVDAGQIMQEKRTFFLFKSKTPVALWKSNLTETFNRGDLIGSSRFTGQDMTASDGVMFQTGGRTWHRGTLEVKRPEGQRTITHLQSLSLPPTHYYFDRPLSDEQAVGLAGGQLKPEAAPGFVGQVSQTEALCPAWAETKRALIMARLYWPPGKGGGMKDEG